MLMGNQQVQMNNYERVREVSQKLLIKNNCELVVKNIYIKFWRFLKIYRECCFNLEFIQLTHSQKILMSLQLIIICL